MGGVGVDDEIGAGEGAFKFALGGELVGEHDDVAVRPGVLERCQKLVAEAIEYVEKLRKGKTDKVFLAALEDEIKSADNRLRAIRRYIRETMFSILLSKNWFDEFPNRVDTTLTLDEFECTVSLTEDRVEF